MTLKRRLNKIEERLKTNEKYRDCELEIQVGVDGEPTTYYCRYADGRREQITDSDIIRYLEDIPGDEISVEIID
jgi:hypothetical protein